MPVRTAPRSITRRAAQARFAAFAAILSLAATAQALAPAGASAVAPNPTAGGCKPVSATYPGAVWNGLEFCAPEQPGEVIEFESWFNPCIRNPSLCMSYQPGQGGAPLGAAGDGLGVGPSSRGGVAGKRPEAPKVRRKKRSKPGPKSQTQPVIPTVPTMEECRTFKGMIVLSPGDSENYDRSREQISTLGTNLNDTLIPQGVVLHQAVRILDTEVARLRRAGQRPMKMKVELAVARREAAANVKQVDSLRRRIRTLDQKAEEIWERGEKAADDLMRQCRSMYGPGFGEDA